MKNKKVLILFALSALVWGLENGYIDREQYDSSIEKLPEIVEKNKNEMDEYLVQTLVESRYETATSVVWVYGCADKT